MVAKNILITGSAGFIGFHLCKTLLSKGHNVVGIDDINDYYDVDLKYARLEELGIKRNSAKKWHNASTSIINKKFIFIRSKIENRLEIPEIFKKYKFDLVCNLAAQAGVRFSIKNPEAYVDSNIVGFLNILECCRNNNIYRLVYASSSSIYGNCNSVPFKENLTTEEPISFYAATKKSNELMAYTYSHLYRIETIGLRFFTVYGPWGRPDMALFLFTDAITRGEKVNIFNRGNLSRDFTYIDDIINGIELTLFENSKNKNLYKLYNIGNNTPVKILDFIEAIENEVGMKSEYNMLPMQAGDVEQTWADVSLLKTDYGYNSTIKINEGVKRFVRWYKEYYEID
jgi:UDP-glucuronate 4-epimerase